MVLQVLFTRSIQGFADVDAGRGAIVIGLAAVIIGTVLFEKIFHNFALKLLSVAIGAVIYYAVLQIVIWLGLDTNYLKLLSALVVAFFLAVPYWKKKYFTKPVKKGAENQCLKLIIFTKHLIRQNVYNKAA